MHDIYNSIIKCLEEEQIKYDFDDYAFPISRSKMASYLAFAKAIEIVKNEFNKYEDKI